MTILLAACTPPAGAQSPQHPVFTGLDEEASRTCRSIIAVINSSSTAVEITGTMRIGEANAIAVSYIARPATGLPRQRKVVCSFRDLGGPARRTRELNAVASDGVPLGPARMRFLTRYWVGSRDAAAAAAELAPAKRR